MQYCNKLFSYENKYAGRHYKPETIKKRRVKDEKPVIEAFLDWADKQVVTGNSKFSKALTYFKNRRNDLMTYLEDGHCSLSNNWSENSIRPVTVGRKNWLYCRFWHRGIKMFKRLAENVTIKHTVKWSHFYMCMTPCH